MAKRKRRVRRKGSRKSAMSHKRTRRGRRTSNPGAVGQVALGVGGFAAAGILGALVRTLVPQLTASTSIYGLRAGISAAGAALTTGMAKMMPESQNITMPLAAGMAANAGVQLMSLVASSSGMTLSNQKFLGLSSTAAPSASAATPGAVPSASAATPGAVPSASAAFIAAAPTARMIVDWAGGAFFDPQNSIPLPAERVSVLDTGGITAFVYTDGDGKKALLVDAGGNVWLPASIGSSTPNKAPLASVGLSGTYPPWAGYPGYNQRGFPQQSVSLPAQIAPQVHGYANYQPAMNGYANYQPAMSGYANYQPTMAGWGAGWESSNA